MSCIDVLHAGAMEPDESLAFPDPMDPVHSAGSMQAAIRGLLAGYRTHEYWSDPLVARQVLRACGVTVAQIGELAGRITEHDAELAAATDHLATLLAWHGRRRDDDPDDRTPAPFPRS